MPCPHISARGLQFTDIILVLTIWIVLMLIPYIPAYIIQGEYVDTAWSVQMDLRVGLLVVQKSTYSGVERWTKSRGMDDLAITLMIRFSKNQIDNFDPAKQGITSLGRGRFLFFQKIDFLKFSCCLPHNELYTSVIQFEDEIILLGPWMPKMVSEIFNYHFNIASKIMG